MSRQELGEPHSPGLCDPCGSYIRAHNARREACAQKELKNGKKMIQHMELIHRMNHFGDAGYVASSLLTG